MAYHHAWAAEKLKLLGLQEQVGRLSLPSHDFSFRGHGSGPSQIALIQQIQTTWGNRAVQRWIRATRLRQKPQVAPTPASRETIALQPAPSGSQASAGASFGPAWAWVEPQLKGYLEIPVPKGDAKTAKLRVNLILTTVRALHRPIRKILLARLENPKTGDELATLFRYKLSSRSRERVLGVLRDESPARTEESDKAKPEAGAPTAGGHVGSGQTAATGSDEMWRQIIGERSTPVGKMGRVRAPKGVRLRPLPGAPSDLILPFDTLVSVQRKTSYDWCWVVSMDERTTGKVGFCEEQFLAIDPPEPTAHLYRVEKGDRLGQIAERYYGKSFRGGNDARLYVQALYEANKHHKGVYLEEVDLAWYETLPRRQAEERTVEIYKGAKVREGLAIWVPSEAFIQQLKAAGALTSGATEIMKFWRRAKAAVSEAIEWVKYAAGFIIGLLEGAWGAITDLFEGAVDMIQTVAKVLYHLVTGNPGAVKDMLMGWVAISRPHGPTATR